MAVPGPLREVGFPKGITQCRDLGLRLLGAPLSVSPGFVSWFVRDKAEEVVLVMDRFASLRPAQRTLAPEVLLGFLQG